jgi:hypothetical protein
MMSEYNWESRNLNTYVAVTVEGEVQLDLLPVGVREIA